MIIVTGGAGFIGSNLAARLVEEGADVVVVDRLGSGGKWKNIAGLALHEFITPCEAPAFADSHGTDIEAVFHLGANSSTRTTDGDAILRTNFRSTVDWFAWCTRAEVPLIYASSAATYGDGTAGFVDDDRPEALQRLRPLNLYGWSKHAADVKIARARACGVPTPPSWYGFKFFNVYGPNEAHKGPMRSAVLALMERVHQGEPAALFRSCQPEVPDGCQRRDFVHVDDVVDVMLWAWRHRPASGLYNLGTGAARTFIDVAQAISRAYGTPPRIEFIDMPADLRGRYQSYTEASVERLRAAGYRKPFTSFEDGIARYVAWRAE
ncbi:ADP-glyceromanno-heptose 6-epimerase [Alsobacter sp. R-9]